MEIAAVASGGGDQKWHTPLFLCLQQDLEVLQVGLAAAGHLAQSELLRARVRRAGIDSDGMGLLREAEPEVLDREAVAQHP
ncbi:hypothetical protein [Enhydrobacter aerosaccus]|uniref:hypothetical protein n=1 Tax=Enhydrobacter aerosaccus TaxID=225324 RepID=UPI001C44C705|nr:hypothetical protein [Enhydrobacter aerosaccus]